MIKYIYCPYCKTSLIKHGNDYYCPKCQDTIYNNPAPTVGVLPIRASQVLLARRAIEPYKGKLDTIGGFLENGELPEAGALREAKEETGLNMEIVEFLGFYTDLYISPQYTMSINFIAKLKDPSAKPVAADDVASLHWVSITDPPWQEIGFKNTAEVLSKLKQWYVKGRM